jgi:excisionase family DNA binding protein
VETYLTIEELAHYLKVAEQTIRRWVLNREIPFCKIKKVIRFRLSEIEKWVDNGCVYKAAVEAEADEDGLFEETETTEASGLVIAETGGAA